MATQDSSEIKFLANALNNKCLNNLSEIIFNGKSDKKCLYYIKFRKDGTIYYKIGITNNFLTRYSNEDIELLDGSICDNCNARASEKEIKKDYSSDLNKVLNILNTGNEEISTHDFLNCFK